MLHYSSHAKTRSHQRSVPAQTVEDALDYGRETYLGNGLVACFLGDRHARRMRRLAGRSPSKKRVQVVVTETGVVVTVMRARRPYRGRCNRRG